MRKFGALLAAVAFTATAPAIAGDQQSADVNYDCALFDECGGDAAPTVSGDPAGVKPAVRSSGNVRGGFTMRREPVETAKPMAAPSGKTRPTTKMGRLTPSKPAMPSGRAQAESVRAAQQITFVSGSAELQSSAKMVANKLAATMMRPDKANVRFRLEGHTDAVGSRESNLDLSKRRAQAVVSYLASQGVDTRRLDAVGFGFDQPLPGTSKFASANRRVVARVAN